MAFGHYTMKGQRRRTFHQSLLWCAFLFFIMDATQEYVNMQSAKRRPSPLYPMFLSQGWDASVVTVTWPPQLFTKRLHGCFPPCCCHGIHIPSKISSASGLVWILEALIAHPAIPALFGHLANAKIKYFIWFRGNVCFFYHKYVIGASNRHHFFISV